MSWIKLEEGFSAKHVAPSWFLFWSFPSKTSECQFFAPCSFLVWYFPLKTSIRHFFFSPFLFQHLYHLSSGFTHEALPPCVKERSPPNKEMGP